MRGVSPIAGHAPGTSAEGSGYIVLAALPIKSNDGAVKWTGGGSPPGETMALRGIFMLAPIALIVRHHPPDAQTLAGALPVVLGDLNIMQCATALLRRRIGRG